MFDTYELGAVQYMVYGCRVAGGFAPLEWFHSGVDLSFVSRPIRRDVERYFRRSCGTPLGMGTRCEQYYSLERELLGNRVHY